MTTYDYGQLQTIWLQSAKGTKYDTKPWARLMAAIALAESGGNPDATNPNDNGGKQTSWGIWQISLGNHNAPAPNWNDPVENGKLAVAKLENPQGLDNWGTYVTGAYKKFMHGTGPTTDGGGGGGGGVLSWLESPVKGLEWAGNFIYGVANPVSGVESTAQNLGSIATGLSGLVTTVSKISQLFLMLFRPQLWLRVGSFILGLVTLVGGLYFIGKSL